MSDKNMAQGQQMRFTDNEIELMKSAFKGNDKLLKLLRKVFLPEIDPNAPLGQMIDLWMTVPVKEMSPDQAMINILARNQLIMHIEQQLMQLKLLANVRELTKEELEEKAKKDSTK